jgi:cytochrome P450
MQRDAFAPDGFGAAIHAASGTGELSEEEAPIVAQSLLTAGVDTTVSGIGAAVYCLARFPEQFARLRADLSLARAAFEEAVRYESPVQTFFRTTTAGRYRRHCRRRRKGADVPGRRQSRLVPLGVT